MLIIARMIAAPVKGDLYRFYYGACLYPEGVVGENLIYFNHEDIFKIVQEVRVMKRIYSILVFGNEENDIMLVLKFTDQKFQSLSDFLILRFIIFICMFEKLWRM